MRCTRTAAEVAILAGQLRAHALGKKVIQASFPPAWAGELPPRPETLLYGSRVAGVDRFATCLIVGFDTGLSMVLQLAKGGTVRWVTGPEPTPEEGRMAVRFERDAWLLVSVEAPGATRLLPSGNLHRLPPLKGLGADVLSAEFTLEVLRAALGKAGNRMVRPLLLDQRRIAGLDEPIVDDILLRARIHPRAEARHLSAHQQRALFEAMREVLRQAVEQGGSATTGFVDLQAKRGRFRSAGWDARSRTCWRCGTPLARQLCARRPCFFCPLCQELS
jgi:formamidopyrimidine-DNA glycosylase